MEGGEARIVAYTKVFAIRARLDKRVRYITDGEKTSLASSITYISICHLFPGHQVVYALHMDSAHCHLHFVVNSVSFEDGKKHFSGFYDLFPVRDFLQECFPRSNVHIYQSFPDSDVNRFGCSDDDELLRID